MVAFLDGNSIMLFGCTFWISCNLEPTLVLDSDNPLVSLLAAIS